MPYKSKKKRKEYRKNWERVHPGHKYERNRKWRASHPEIGREYSRNYRMNHPDAKIAANACRKASKLNNLGNGCTLREWEMVKRMYGRCAYCGAKTKLTLDHVIPLSKGGQTDISNIVPACGPCNYSKHNRGLLEFFKML